MLYQGTETTELSVSNLLFKLKPDILLWKISLTISSLQDDILSNGTSDLLIKKNEPPLNGTCFVDKNKGYALETYFLIKCLDWIDIDGFIARYEYFGSIFIKKISSFLSKLILFLLFQLLS